MKRATRLFRRRRSARAQQHETVLSLLFVYCPGVGGGGGAVKGSAAQRRKQVGGGKGNELGNVKSNFWLKGASCGEG